MVVEWLDMRDKWAVQFYANFVLEEKNTRHCIVSIIEALFRILTMMAIYFFHFHVFF